MQLKPTLQWLPSLYFFQALPFFLVTSVAAVLYKHYGINNETLAFYTSVFYFPWVIKAFAGPFVENHGEFKTWIYFTQAACGAILCLLAIFTSHGSFVEFTLVAFLLMAVIATFHDVAAEGLYLHALTHKEHSFYVGWRASFFRLGWITMQGGVIALVGILLEQHWNMNRAWQIALFGTALSFFVFAVAHRFTIPTIPKPQHDHPRDYESVIVEFFKEKHIWAILFYLLCFRLGESQLQKLAIPFLLDQRGEGGLALSTKNVGVYYGTLGTLALSIGGIISGWMISKGGLKKWIVPLTWAINIPHLLYVWLAYAQPSAHSFIIGAIMIEQFFYGMAFSAYLIFIVQTCRKGKYPTASYAIATGFMSLGMMLPGAWSGWLQSKIGYTSFFIWVAVCSVPSIWSAHAARKCITSD